MRRFWSWLGLNAGKHFGVVAALGVVLTVGLGIGLTRLQFKTDNASYLNRTDTAFVDNARYQAAFGGDDMVAMFTMDRGRTVEDLLRPADRAALAAVSRRLQAVPGVQTVISPLDVVHLVENGLASPTGNVADSPAARLQLAALAAPQPAASRALRTKSAAATLARYAAVAPADRVLGNRAWDHFLLYANDGHLRPGVDQYFVNHTHAVLFVHLAGNLSIARESHAAAAITRVLQHSPVPGTTVVTTGTPSFLKTLNDYLRGGMVRLTGVAVLIMVAILLLLFDVRWRLLPLVVVGFGLIWAFGLVGYLGVPLTLASIAALPTMLGIGIDYAIQMHSRVEEEVLLERVAHPIQATARNLGPALLVVTFDAVFAFLALQLSAVPMIRQFGEMLAIGVAVICLGSILGPLAVLGIREYRSPSGARRPRRDFSRGRLSRLVVRLGRLPRGAAVPLALASLAVFAGGLAVAGRLAIQTDAVAWINPQSPTIEAIHRLQRQVHTAGELDVLVSGPSVMTDRGIAYVAAMQRRVTRLHADQLKPATSLVATAEAMTAVPGAAPVTPTAAEVRTVASLLPPALRRMLLDPSFGPHHTPALDVVFISKTANLDQLQGAVRTVEAQHPPAGMRLSPGGIAAVGAGLIHDIEEHRNLVTDLAIVFVAAWLAIRLRSFVRALLSVVPVLIAVGVANLVVYGAGIVLSPATAVSGPIVVAVCTEFTSLLLLRYLEERSRGHEPRAAFDATSARTGRAFVVSGMTAVAGVAVLASSSMPILSGFGEVVAFDVFIALVSALVVLPPVVVWADQRGWVSRGMLRPDPDALAPAPTDDGAGAAEAAG